MASDNNNDLSASRAAFDGGGPPPPDEAQEIVRALSEGEVDAVVVEKQGAPELMALAKLTDLDEINELIRALRSGEIDAFVANEEHGERIYSVAPIHEVLAQQYYLTKAITDNASTALFILDDKQQCIFMNPAAEQLIGYSFDELRHQRETFHDIVHHKHADGSPYPLDECPINRAFPSGEQMKGEEVFVRKNGETFDVSFAASPIHDVAGQPVGTVIEVRDITERKKIEQALRDADKRKDEFIATLAHELRNPLAPIANVINLAKRSAQDPEVVEPAFEMIERNLSKLVRLVDDLLDVSRITHNAIELRRQPIELTPTINDAIDMCRPMIDQLGHSFRVELPTETIYLNADAARISQVLGNLINNACKFTPDGGEIKVRAETVNGDVIISVRDSGVGIADGQLSGIFEMFSQVRNPISDDFGGLGIGLALAKQLVEMHGGSIEAKSDGEWLGSEFLVRLPVMDAAEVPAAPPEEIQIPAPSGKRVLVVDDNYDSADSMATLLKLTGNECKIAHSGHTAVELAETFGPDIILLDIGLPHMDGYEVCKTIRAQSWGADISIIAMTGWGQDEDRKRSREAGFDFHLVKPVDFRELSRLVADIPQRYAKNH
jgi:PAS domain S-box-containing protein